MQLEGVLQANANRQAGASIAAASSGSVEVKSHDDITAGGDAITATSSAVAGADLAQTATQSNDNSATATGSIALQGQLVGQLNANEQEGAAIAAATSDYVNVEQTNVLKRGGDGITATSSAVAGANLAQSADQSNSNSASATLEAPDQLIFLELGDTRIPLRDVGIQAQLVGQLNVNDQDGAAIAAASSGPVEVRSFDDPATGNGITATSSAVAAAGLTQSVSQSNSNSASITLPPRPVETGASDGFETGVEIAAQLEGVLQANVSEQEAVAVAAASSDDVLVEQGGALSAGLDGVTATSSAVATAGLTQTADQSNSDSKTIERADEAPLTDGQRMLHPTALDVQLEGVLQANASSQRAAAIAAASSGSVDVRSDDAVKAGGDGITATSSAVAAAGLSQTANQSNSNSASATGTLVLQGQLVGQLNANEQEGAAIAAATSDYVNVDHSGSLTAGGNGITATSSAVAAAALDQTANQSNENSATATLELPDQVIGIPLPSDDAELRRILIVGPAAAQAQLAGQLNLNDQDGAAIADATSSYVEVRSDQDPSQGNGITATSSAVAAAALNQTADQSNSNSASITLPASEVVDRAAELQQIRATDVGVQLEAVLQANVNEQEGVAVASATSDYVKVDQSGSLNAKGDGITATSSAVAAASLGQSATQSNTDTKEIARADGPTPGPDQIVIPRPTLDLQLEGVLQANVNSQSAAALATASSGSVEVRTEDQLVAGGDGITATSSAVAAANLDQSVEQDNTNSVAATGNGILQGQLVGQANINASFDREEGLEPGQAGVAAAEATSDHVYVDQSGVLKPGGNGITATSSAVATAALNQSADQANTNSASATIESLRTVIAVPALAEIDPELLLRGQTAIQAQLAAQLNVSVQEGLATASATSDYVEVRSEDPAAGNGIIATSSAVGVATLTQTANQSNDNSATITLPPLQVIPGGTLEAVAVPLETAEQAELVIQANINEQEGAALADATSGSVTVESGLINVSGDGVSATSSAVAVATLDQTANQSNTDTKTVQRAVGPTPGDGEIVVPPFTGVAQEEFVVQANISEQDGEAVATATSDSVFVKSDGSLSAGGNGINATSSAVAVASLNQSVTQDNTNSINAVGTQIGGDAIDRQLSDGGGQDQIVIQANLNAGFEEEDPGQEAAATASATSGSVYVEQDGTLKAVGNGITATSSAVAVAALNQSANQANSNSASATLEQPRIGFVSAAQEQRVLQVNESAQAGEVTADATSDSVEVRSAQDPAQGDGIDATSSAVATAGLTQTANQENENTSTITLPSETRLVEEHALQRQRIEQSNESKQDGEAVATAASDYVSVEQSGVLSAGGNGITATSSAVAAAGLTQTATQSNSNTQEVVREAPADGETPALPLHQHLPGPTRRAIE